MSIDPDGFTLRAAGFWQTYGIAGTVSAYETGSRVQLSLEPVLRFGRLSGALAAMASAGLFVVACGLFLWPQYPPVLVQSSTAVAAVALGALIGVRSLAERGVPDREVHRLTRGLSALLDARLVS